MVTIPGTDVKHVYSNDLAEKVMRAIARTLEQEKYRLFNKRYRKWKTAKTRHKPLCQ